MGLNMNLKFLVFNWKYLSIMFAVLLLILAIFYVFKYYVQPKMNPQYVANKEYEASSNKDTSNVSAPAGQIDINMFTVDWCPHCKKAKPEWDKFKDTYHDKIVNGYKINLRTVNCTNEDDSEVKNLLDQFNIDGFPTIKAVKNGKVYDYDAKPESNNLKQFLDMLTN